MSSEPVHITDLNFNDLKKNHSLVLIDFWASWCGSCRALAPIINELTREYSRSVLFSKLNVDGNPITTKSFEILSIPTIVIMKNGYEIERIVGLVPKNQIEEIIKKHSG